MITADYMRQMDISFCGKVATLLLLQMQTNLLILFILSLNLIDSLTVLKKDIICPFLNPYITYLSKQLILLHLKQVVVITSH